MPQSAALVDALKRELKAKGLTYADVARRLRTSEATVKRMFSRKNFTLKRLDQLCDAAGIGLAQIARSLHQADEGISRLTLDQEKEIASNPKLCLVALLSINDWTFEQIVSTYDISRAECVQLLARLDRLRIIELLPNNRIRLLIKPTFSWLPQGPIQRFFTESVAPEFFDSGFTPPDGLMLFVNVRVTDSSRALLVRRIRRVAKEIADQQHEDTGASASERSSFSVLLAARAFESEVFKRYRRQVAEPPARKR